MYVCTYVCMYNLEKLSKLIFQAKAIKNSFVFFLEFFLKCNLHGSVDGTPSLPPELLKCSLG